MFAAMHPPPAAGAQKGGSTSPAGRSALRGARSRANLVVQVHRVIEVVPGEARETGFPAHPLGSPG